MKVTQSRGFTHEFTCELTEELDKLAGLSSVALFHHYLLVDKIGIQDRVIPLRVQGGTVGCVHLAQDSNKIVEIDVYMNYVVNTYPADVLKHLDKFISQVLELDEEVIK